MNRILLLNHHGLGDLIMALPATRWLVAERSAAEIWMTISGHYEKLLIDQGCPQHLFYFRLSSNPLRKAKILFELRRFNFDSVIAFYGFDPKMVSIFSKLIGAKNWICHPISEKECFDRNTLHKCYRHIHIVEDFLGMRFPEKGRPKYLLDTSRFPFPNQLADIGKYIVLVPGCGELERFKRWPVEEFIRFSKIFRTNFPEVHIVITGNSEEFDLGEAIKRGIGHTQVINLCGKLGLRKLAALFRESLMVLGGDCGGLHVAKSAGARVVAIMGPTNSALTGPIDADLIIDRKLSGTPWYCRRAVKENPYSDSDLSMRIPGPEVFETLVTHGFFSHIAGIHSENTGRCIESRFPPINVGARINSRKYQICANCVMDTTDSEITFDDKGICDHCNEFYKNIQPKWYPDDHSRNELESIVAKIKSFGKNQDFDCLLGVSGGADSSYMLHLAVKEFGLRPLVFHVDGGWNSELAVHNIQVLVDKLGLDLYTEVINWEEMRDFQLAFFKAGVPHIDLPQDHAFIATLYNFAEKYGIRYILNGGNISTEGVRNPMEWMYYGTDMVHIGDIIRQFGTVKMETFPFSSIFKHKIYLRYIRRVHLLKPLNYLPYVKAEAMQVLQREYGWKPYPQKHFESRFTKFYEGYWLPERFGFDTRKVQYSSLILTGQMTRAEALKRLQMPAYDADTIRDEFNYIATKLNISLGELRHYFTLPKKFYWDFRNQATIFKLGAHILKTLGVEKSIKR